QGRDLAVDGALLLLGQGVAVGHGLVIDGIGLVGALEGGIEEVVVPGGIVLGHISLLVQRLGGVNKHAQVFAVGVGQVLVGAAIEVVDHGGGQGMIASVGDHTLTPAIEVVDHGG